MAEADILIDSQTRVLLASDLKLAAKRHKAPINWAQDRILILDPKTNQPIGTYQPLPRRAGAPPLEPVLSSDGSAEAPLRLTEAEKERLARIWMDHPDWGGLRIANQFQLVTGRKIMITTAERYRPESLRRRRDPSPEEIEAEKKAIRNRK